jgi:hypothetical protein
MAETERVFPEKLVIITDRAAYHLTITPFRHPYTNILEHYTIGLGSRKEKCVQLNTPSIESGKKEGDLIWVKKSPECFLDSKKDSSLLTQHTLLLGLTIARDINPTCTRYKFNDCSKFPCKLPDGKEDYVSMKAFYIAFHGGTWYETQFGARLTKKHELYEKLKLNMYDPSKKPSTYNFGNVSLNEILMPIYSSTNTWNEFFQAIQDKFGDKKCSVIYPWIVNTMNTDIFDEEYIFEKPNWYIEMKDNDKTPLIPFKTYEDTMSGGSKTRKRKRRASYYNIPPIYFRDIPRIQAFDYYKFLGISKK